MIIQRQFVVEQLWKNHPNSESARAESRKMVKSRCIWLVEGHRGRVRIQNKKRAYRIEYNLETEGYTDPPILGGEQDKVNYYT